MINVEIEIFTLADYAQDTGNGKLVIVGTWDTLFSKAFPFRHPQCSIAIRMRVSNKDAGVYPFEVRLLAPDKKEMGKVSGSMTVKENPHTDYSVHNIVFNLANTEFKEPGKYAIELFIDGEWQRGLIINALKRP